MCSLQSCSICTHRCSQQVTGNQSLSTLCNQEIKLGQCLDFHLLWTVVMLSHLLPGSVDGLPLGLCASELSLFISLGVRETLSQRAPCGHTWGLGPGSFTQSLGTRPGNGWEASGFPQSQPHTISFYSWHVLTQARGQTDNNQVGLSLLRFPDT